MLSPEIQLIRDKVISTGWPKFIQSITINGMHGFQNRIIEFKFPICAIVGENGTGKSTLLKFLACAYKSPRDENNTFFPSAFFPSTTWDNIKNINVDFQIRLGDNTSSYKIKKLIDRWRGITDRPENDVFYFDLNRTQPIESLIGYSKLANRQIQETSSRNLTSNSVGMISEIMGKKYLVARYAKTGVDVDKEIGILGFSFGEISQFHQGTGELIATDFISTIEAIPDTSLIIIDEIESSLHPKAQRRFIHRLLNLARAKTLQIIVSTHSPYILGELPKESRILLTRNDAGVEVIYAPTVEFCLSQIDDIAYSELDIIVEDKEAKAIISEIIRAYVKEVNERIRILPAGSADVVKQLARLSEEKKVPYSLLGIVDADQPTSTNTLKLPGEYAPEKQIINDVASGHADKLVTLLNLPAEQVSKELRDVQTILNHHEWIQRLSVKFNVDEPIIWSWLVSVWVKYSLTPDNPEVKLIIDKIKNRLGIFS